MGAACVGAGAAAPLPNISANGFPNCNKSSEAFALELGAALVSCTGASKRSTMGAELAAGAAAKKGFVDGLIPPLAPGDETFDCC